MKIAACIVLLLLMTALAPLGCSSKPPPEKPKDPVPDPVKTKMDPSTVQPR